MTSANVSKKKLGKRNESESNESKNKILDAALHLFATKGYNSTSLRDIANLADVSHSLIRHHFGSKESLWKACIQHGFDKMADIVAPLTEKVTPENALESMKTIIRLLVTSAAKQPDLWSILSFEALKNSERLDHVIEVITPINEMVYPVFQLAQDSGHFKSLNETDVFVFVASAGAVPYSMQPLYEKLTGEEVLVAKNAEMHANFLIEILLKGD